MMKLGDKVKRINGSPDGFVGIITQIKKIKGNHNSILRVKSIEGSEISGPEIDFEIDSSDSHSQEFNVEAPDC